MTKRSMLDRFLRSLANVAGVRSKQRGGSPSNGIRRAAQKPFSLRLEELEKRDLLSVEPFATAQTGPAELIAQNSAAVVQEQISLASNAAADGSGTVSTSERLGEDNRSAKGGAPAAGNSISVVIKDCEIYNNEAAGNGGALYVGRGDASVSNSAITDNTAKRGGGIYAETDQTVTVASNTISGNTATEEGGGIFACGPVCLYNTIVSLNSLNDLAGTGTFSAYNSLSSNVTLVEGENNLVYDAAKPLFADAENGDYRLAENSQAHNAGSNDYVSQDTDLAGERRIVGSAVDIGAYELFQPDLSFNQYSKTVTAVVDRNVVLTRGVVATDLDNPTYTVQIEGVKSTKITVNKTWGQIVYSGGINGLPARDEPYVVTVTASAANGSASAEFLLTVVDDSAMTAKVSTNSPKYNNLVRATVKPTAATVTYQWYRTKNATPATAVWTAISDATKATYVPTTGDLGYYLKVVARGTNSYAGHASQAITSGKVTRPILSVTLPTTVEVNRTLTAFMSPSSATATYQWYRGSNDEGWTAIKNATGVKYVPQQADVGKFLKVTVTGKGNYTGTITKITGKRVTAPLISVSLAGKLKVGSTLTPYPSPGAASVTYQWYSSKDASTWTAISGATSKTYTLTPAEAGKYVKLTIKGTGYYKGTLSKMTASKISSAQPVSLTSVKLSTDAPEVGAAIKATLAQANATATYQWYRGSQELGWTSIAGAIAASYVPTANDVEFLLKVVATGTGLYRGTATATTANAVIQRLPAPTASITSKTSTAVQIKIGAVENAATYVVEYATASDFANALTKSYSSSGSKWITGLTKNATYYFRVKATSASEDYAESHYGETLCNVDESSAILDEGPLLVEFEDTNSTNSVLAARAALIAQISSGLNDEENMFETVELDLDWYSLDD